MSIQFDANKHCVPNGEISHVPDMEDPFPGKALLSNSREGSPRTNLETLA
jgi:hypothetical protein